MPVKIVLTPTRSDYGEVNQADLVNIKSQFSTLTTVNPVAPRTVVNKRVSFFFDKGQLLNLFDKAPAHKGVRITIGIQKEDTIDICHQNEGNNMCAVVETYLDFENKESLHTEGSYVLINGYKDEGLGIKIDSGSCCPSSEPPPGGGNS